MPFPALRPAARILQATATLAAGGWTLRALHGTPAALGAAPSEIHAVTERSPHCRDGVFANTDPTSLLKLDREERWFMLRQLIFGATASRPRAGIPVLTPNVTDSLAPLAVSWFGHATALIEIDGYRLLTDPVFSERCSPSDTIGPQRMHPPPIHPHDLPAVDAIIISHDHYDHLDIDSVAALARTQRAPFVVPLGVGAHLRGWGVAAQRIIELDWHESTRIGELTLACSPARHFSGRFLTRNLTLWASWAIIGPRHRVYFAGDTGYTDGFAEIGAQFGPFDATLMPIGAYNAAWPDVHLNPEEAVRGHVELNGADPAPAAVLVPIHWGTFRLAPHPWAEPVERLLAAAADAGVVVAVPRPGERVLPDALAEPVAWWRF